MSVNEWADLISKHSTRNVETPEKGYKTAQQLSREWGLKTARTGHILKELEEEKKIQVKTFRIKTGNKTYPVPHYKIIK